MSYESSKSNIDKFIEMAGRVVDDASDIYHAGKEVAQDAKNLEKEIKKDFSTGGTSSDFTPSPAKQEERKKQTTTGESWFSKFLKWFFGF